MDVVNVAVEECKGWNRVGGAGLHKYQINRTSFLRLISKLMLER